MKAINEVQWFHSPGARRAWAAPIWQPGGRGAQMVRQAGALLVYRRLTREVCYWSSWEARVGFSHLPTDSPGLATLAYLLLHSLSLSPPRITYILSDDHS